MRGINDGCFIYLSYLLVSIVFVFIANEKGQGQVKLDSTVISSRTLVDSLHVPWEIKWGPEGYIWMTERSGRVSRVDPDNGTLQILKHIKKVQESGESGLLGLALHPDFPDSAYIYIVFTYQVGNRLFERLSRYTFHNDTLKNPQVLLDSIDGNSFHDGARLMISDDRRLWMTTGDAGDQQSAQRTRDRNGKVLRVTLTGNIPDGNPIGNAVWSWGHRNPQGLVQLPGGKIFISEHGPATDDEINLIKKGRNYGWPDVKGYCDKSGETAFCRDSNIVEPLKAWTPTIAPCGLDYYNHEEIPEWQSTLLLVNLKQDDLRVLALDRDKDSIISERIYFDNSFGRLRDICIAPDGRLFLATSNRDGRANDGFPVARDDRIIVVRSIQFDSSHIPAGEQLHIYPNPVRQVFNVQLQPQLLHQGKELTFTLYKINGQQVKKVKLLETTNIINIPDLSAAIYLYAIQREDKTIATGKLLKD